MRVYSHVTETPVEENIHLREERATVERRPANRAAGADAFRERSIEIDESREEAVVSKEARVVGEVVVGQEVTERNQTVRDKVRRSDVEVEHLDEGQLRKQYDQSPRFAQSGLTFDEYKPACAFGRELAAKHPGREWSTIEPQAKQEFEQRRPGKWNQMKEAVQQGFESARA